MQGEDRHTITSLMREFDLIHAITEHNRSLSGRVTIPPGDDMAGLRIGDCELLVAVDQVIDKVHFDSASATLEQIGRKAVTRNLSDVAAMAGKPLATLCAIALPRGMSRSDASRLLDAVRSTAASFDCPLIGGDTSIHNGPLAISVTILAEDDGIKPVRRQGAKPGDDIYVTGMLGGSLYSYQGRIHHLDFEPRIALARQLAGNTDTRPTAMIDLSDGLARDLPHMVAGAEIIAHTLPITPVARLHATRDGRPGWLHAVADGEDYELLFTASAHAKIPASIDGVAITRIGRVTDSKGIVLVNGGELITLDGLGWEHHG